MRATTGNLPSGNLWQFFIARHDDVSVYPISPSTLLRKSVPPPPLPPALHKRERTLSAVIMFSLFTGLYTGSVGGNQEGRYYATPSATSKLDLPRVPHGGEKKSQRSGHGYHLAPAYRPVICVDPTRGESFVSTFEVRIDFLISKIEYGR